MANPWCSYRHPQRRAQRQTSGGARWSWCGALGPTVRACTLRAAPSGLGQSVCASRGHTVARRELQAGGPELAAGGHDVAPARRAYRARVARLVDDLGEALDLLPVRAFVRRTRPGVER